MSNSYINIFIPLLGHCTLFFSIVKISPFLSALFEVLSAPHNSLCFLRDGYARYAFLFVIFYIFFVNILIMTVWRRER